MADTSEQYQYKLVLIGDGAVGKSSLRRTYLGKKFDKEYLQTIGADFALLKRTLKDIQFSASIWDLAGQAKFQSVRRSYYLGTSGALLVYSIKDQQSLENVEKWLLELRSNLMKKDIPVLMIGNKSDLKDDTYDQSKAEHYFNELNEKYENDIMHIETSALTGENVEQAFDSLILKIYEDSEN